MKPSEIVRLAAAGEAGVRHAIDVLAEELRMAMALSGARSLGELDRAMLRQSAPPRVDDRGWARTSARA